MADEEIKTVDCGCGCTPVADKVNTDEVVEVVQPKEEVKAEEEVAAEGQLEEVKAEATEFNSTADDNKAFINEIMAEMDLKGGAKKRIVRLLAVQYNYDKHMVLWSLKRALITERYAAAVEAAGGH